MATLVNPFLEQLRFSQNSKLTRINYYELIFLLSFHHLVGHTCNGKENIIRKYIDDSITVT